MLRVTLPQLPGVTWTVGPRLEVVEDGILLGHMGAQQALGEFFAICEGVDDLEAVGHADRHQALEPLPERDELTLTIYPERTGVRRVEVDLPLYLMLNATFREDLLALLDRYRDAEVRAVL